MSGGRTASSVPVGEMAVETPEIPAAAAAAAAVEEAVAAEVEAEEAGEALMLGMELP